MLCTSRRKIAAQAGRKYGFLYTAVSYSAVLAAKMRMAAAVHRRPDWKSINKNAPPATPITAARPGSRIPAAVTAAKAKGAYTPAICPAHSKKPSTGHLSRATAFLILGGRAMACLFFTQSPPFFSIVGFQPGRKSSGNHRKSSAAKIFHFRRAYIYSMQLSRKYARVCSMFFRIMSRSCSREPNFSSSRSRRQYSKRSRCP